MARRHAIMRSGVSIRLVPTALLLDAALNRMSLGFVPGALLAGQNPATTFQNVANSTIANAGPILADIIAAIVFTKIFPRTPGIRLGRFRVSL